MGGNRAGRTGKNLALNWFGPSSKTCRDSYDPSAMRTASLRKNGGHQKRTALLTRLTAIGCTAACLSVPLVESYPCLTVLKIQPRSIHVYSTMPSRERRFLVNARNRSCTVFRASRNLDDEFQEADEGNGDSHDNKSKDPSEEKNSDGSLSGDIIDQRLDSDDDGLSEEVFHISEQQDKLQSRIVRLEDLVAKQEVEIRRLKKQCDDLKEVSQAFTRVVQLLARSGLDTAKPSTITEKDEDGDNDEHEGNFSETSSSPQFLPRDKNSRIVESFDDSMIFGVAPASVIDAADAAGSAILAAMLGGKQRMLVDVRDAELSQDSETLVQFIELACLPIAAGLEGLKSTRNRVKIVFPTVSQLLEYRRTMALAAPEVVALSTLGFEPVEKRDKIVVIVAPAPDDEEGLEAMHELLSPKDPNQIPVQQPVVILNYHMLPVTGLPPEFETAYHLRLLSVQYMSSQQPPKAASLLEDEVGSVVPEGKNHTNQNGNITKLDDDEELEALMRRAYERSTNIGTTRAMVIRAYPKPWHVFVDTSPDPDADFEVAATFDVEPSQQELNFAIVECLEGSEREDEIVAQQMQEAFESGQLDGVSDRLKDVLDGSSEGIKGGDGLDGVNEDDDEDDDDDPDYFDMFEEDSV